MKLGTMWPLLMKVIRFGLVGCIGMAIDFTITYVLKEKLHTNKYLSNTLGFCIAATNNFFLNRYWTFQNNNPAIEVQYIKFVAIASIGAALSNTLIWLVHDRWKQNFYLSKAISIVIVMAWNFAANNWYTFA